MAETAAQAVISFFQACGPHLFAAVVVCFTAWRLICHRRLSAGLAAAARIPREHDVIIIGGSIAGPPLALQLARQGRDVLLLETNLDRPDRIVGELMQPGGLEVLRQIGLEHCARKVGCHCSGYTSYFEGEWVHLPYENGVDGVSFHFGDFVVNMRKEILGYNASSDAKASGGRITVIEATATDLMMDPTNTVVIGTHYKRTADKTIGTATAHLVALCDGGFSKFRESKKRRSPHSYFVGVILKDLKMPFETRGHVMLLKDGPVLSYRLDKNEVRILADYHSTSLKNPSGDVLLPWLRDEIMPQMPPEYQACLAKTLELAKTSPNAIRTHPHYLYTPLFPSRRGIIAIGDSGNQRHPLTGGGMTCALRDAVHLAEHLGRIPFLGDEARVHSATLAFLRNRMHHTSVVNILSWALHGVFRGPMAMRRACFAYFQLGGDCVRIPMAFLSAINSSVALLLYHYVSVMIYGAYIVFSNKGVKGNKGTGADLALGLINPMRWFTAFHLMFSATRIFGPLVVIEFGAPGHLIDPTTTRVN